MPASLAINFSRHCFPVLYRCKIKSSEEIRVELTHETKLSLLTDGIYWDDTSSKLSVVAIFHIIACVSRKLSQVGDISPNRSGCGE